MTGHPNGMRYDEYLNRSAAQRGIKHYCSCGRVISGNIGWASHRRRNPEHFSAGYSKWLEAQQANGAS